MENDLRQSINNRIQELISLKGNSDKKIVFSVGNTRVPDSSSYYITPIRFIDNLLISGVVLFSETEGSVVFKLLDGNVDFIFVDCEKKSKNTQRGFFNLERLSVELIVKSKLFFYKGNDLTVDSIDSFIFQFYKSSKQLLGGKNILVVGVGNVGFKIALKLVERGANVFLKSRDHEKAKLLADTINLIKPSETISRVQSYSIEVDYDTVILSHLKPLTDNDNVVKSLHSRALIIDVGKGCLTSHQIEILHDKNILSFRLDIGETFQNQIKLTLSGNNKFNIPKSKLLSVGYSIIEPGIIGKENDIVVDSIEHPKVIYGICNGIGGLTTNIARAEIFKQIWNE
ncbi:MAG: NAD(P)-binding domain-containing protein [Flammeovirgaceae bacterium]|nr:NAD(P)-binding domain-containing protein [Flammeovirgaceae bacterium]